MLEYLIGQLMIILSLEWTVVVVLLQYLLQDLPYLVHLVVQTQVHHLLVVQTQVLVLRPVLPVQVLVPHLLRHLVLAVHRQLVIYGFGVG